MGDPILRLHHKPIVVAAGFLLHGMQGDFLCSYVSSYTAWDSVLATQPGLVV